MEKQCSVCASEHRESIEQALESGASLREVESMGWGVSRSALARHRAHIANAPSPPTISEAPTMPQAALPDLVALWTEQVSQAQETYLLARERGRVKDMADALARKREALEQLTALGAMQPAVSTDEPVQRKQRGLTIDMAKSIVIDTLGLSPEQADRLLGKGSPAPLNRPAPRPTPAQQADDAEARWRERLAATEEPPPKLTVVQDDPSGGDPDFHPDCECRRSGPHADGTYRYYPNPHDVCPVHGVGGERADEHVSGSRGRGILI